MQSHIFSVFLLWLISLMSSFQDYLQGLPFPVLTVSIISLTYGLSLITKIVIIIFIEGLL